MSGRYLSKSNATIPCSGRKSVGMGSMSIGPHGTFQEVKDLKIQVSRRLRHTGVIYYCEHCIEVETGFHYVRKVVF